MQEEIADYLINSLRELDEEYGAFVKEAEEIYEQDLHAYEIRQCKQDEKYRFVHDVVERSATLLDDMERRWEEKKISGKIDDIHELMKICQKESAACARKHDVLKRKLNIEKMKMESLNKLISNTSMCGDTCVTKQEELKIILNDLERLSVTESMYPSALLEMHSSYTDLQKKVKELEDKLSKYADLPPDYEKARDKLFEAQLTENKLEKQIRKMIQKN